MTSVKQPEAAGQATPAAAPAADAAAGKEQDVLYVQDAGFNVKVAVPGVEPITIQVSSMELVQEIHQLLMDREDTCHRTCFSLQLDGVPLDNFAELKSVEGLKEGSVLKVVEEPYTVREARIHIRHLRDLLKSTDNSDAYNGVECSSLAFLHTVCQGDVLTQTQADPKKAKAGMRSPQEGIDCTPPEYLMPEAEARPILPLHPAGSGKEAAVSGLASPTANGGNGSSSPQMGGPRGPACVRVVTTSAWNPPPGHRRLHGDLLYVQVVTLEDKRYHITASTRGFYVNQSTEQVFNPAPASSPSVTYHSLIDLLTHLSPAFKKNFGALQKRRTGRHPFERVATPYQVYSWLAPKQDHTLDAIRAEDAFSSKLGYEEHIPGQTRDWNEELQTTRELPRKTLPERLLRERAIFKVHSDFVSAATRGAMAVIDGNVMAINPGEDAKMQMFIWNNIFFSLGFDVRDHYKDLGGDSAAFVAPRNDLQGVKVYNAVDLEGLYTLGTCVLDYRGFRVTAQSIIPGILEREQEQSVVYGSIDFGKTVVSHPKYMELLQKAGSQLKILPHSVVNDKGQEVLLCSSVECKGIIGNDGRHYILDLLRTFPPDVNFLQLEEGEVSLSREAKAFGLPITHNHKLSCLRQELVDAFVESRYMMFIKYAAVQLQQLGIKKQMDMLNTKDKDGKDKENSKPAECENKANKKEEETAKVAAAASVANAVPKKSVADDEEAKKIVESITDSITSGDKRDIEESTKDIVKKAAQAVGSLKETEFDIRFNPDVFSPGVKHVTSEAAQKELKKQCALTRDAADFLVTVQIPAFIRDCIEQTSVPMDGQTLSDNLHNRGINIRYIGVLANMLTKVTQLKYIHTLTVSEILLRSAKHVFTSYLQSLDLTCLSAAASHFLNALFSSPVMPAAGEELVGGGGGVRGVSKRKGRNRKGHRSGGSSANSGGLQLEGLDWASLTSASLWKLLQDEAQAYYNFTLPSASMDEFVSAYNAQRVSLLRSFTQKVGLQLQLREYVWDSKHTPIFADDDVINMVPRAKHINPRASDAYNFYTTGQSKIQQGYLKDGYELISEALNLLNNVYGAMHPEIAQCLRMLARLNYIMGDHCEALSYQQKAVLMSERVNGIDHPYTITEYVHMALYCFANSQVSLALKLLYRARYLCLIVCGENHPEVALIDGNIGLILFAVGEYELALKFFDKALSLNKVFHGELSLKAAVSHHLVSQARYCMGDFRGALQSEKETFMIYKTQLGDDHDKTKESSERLKELTHQAVNLQKKMNDICVGKAKTNALAPLPIQSPTVATVLDLLNVLNGILFVHISQQDVDNIKQSGPADTAKQVAKELTASVDTAENDGNKEKEKKEPVAVAKTSKKKGKK